MHRARSLVFAPLLLSLAGCWSAADHFAFFPDRTFTVADDRLPPGTTRLTLGTDDGEHLEAFYLKRADSDPLVLYFPGNAGNISRRLPELEKLAACGANVLGLGYRGYGASTGKPSEAGIYRDGYAAFDYATHTLGFPPDRIFLAGRSLGSTVAVEIGGGRVLAGVVLVTPLSCGRDYAKAHGMGTFASLAGDSFDNLAKAGNLKAPVLVIHGRDDEVIPFALGQRLYDRLTGPKRMIVIEHGRHNDLQLRDPALYWGAIERFLADPASVASDPS